MRTRLVHGYLHLFVVWDLYIRVCTHCTYVCTHDLGSVQYIRTYMCALHIQRTCSEICTFIYVHIVHTYTFCNLYSTYMCALYVQYTCSVMSSHKFKACFMCERLFVVNAMLCIAARSGCEEHVFVEWYFLWTRPCGNSVCLIG